MAGDFREQATPRCILFSIRMIRLGLLPRAIPPASLVASRAKSEVFAVWSHIGIRFSFTRMNGGADATR